MLGDFRVGPQVAAPGTPVSPSTGRKAELLFAETRGKFYDLNYNGRLFHGSTAVAGASVNGAASLAQTSAITLSNPVGSGVNAAILKAFWQYVSGTMGLSGLMWAYCAAASTGGTAGTVTSGSLKTPGGAACTVWSGATSFSATSILLRPSGISFGAFVGGAGNPTPPVVEVVDGDIIVPPGFTVGLVAIGAAGTSDKSIMGLAWSEEPG